MALVFTVIHLTMAPKFASVVKIISMIANVIVSLLTLMLLGVGIAMKTVGFTAIPFMLYLVTIKNTIPTFC